MTFVKGQDVAVVEHDPDTRKPREGGRVYFGTVALTGASLVKVSCDLPCAAFWQEAGWRVVDGGTTRWRLVPICTRCDDPVPEAGTDGLCTDCRGNEADRQFQRAQEG